MTDGGSLLLPAVGPVDWDAFGRMLDCLSEVARAGLRFEQAFPAWCEAVVTCFCEEDRDAVAARLVEKTKAWRAAYAEMAEEA